MNALLRILALIRKELLAVLKEPRGRITLFLPAIAQCLLFGYAATYDVSRIPYAVIDEDRSAESRAFLAKLESSHVFERVATLTRPQQMVRVIDNREALVGIEIGQRFSAHLHDGTPAPVQVIADGRNSNTASIATLYITSIAGGFVATHPDFAIQSRYWYNANAESRWHFVPGMIATLTMLQILLLSSMAVAREREQGTFDQLLVTPLTPVEIMIGKALPAIAVGAMQSTLVLGVGWVWFRVPIVGSLDALYLGLGLFLMASIGIGLLISSLAMTMQQAMLYTFLLLMPFILLSGLTTPISSMPVILQYFTVIDPLRFAVDLVGRVMLEGASIVGIWPDLWPLLLISALTLPAAAWLFRNRL